MKQFLRILQPSVVLAVFVAAVWVLYGQLRDFRYEEFTKGLSDINANDLALAIGLTVLNYVVLLGYDYLAIRYLKHPLPAKKLMLASFVGNVASLNFGSLLGGTSVRFRFYALWKFSGVEILQLVVILGLTFWLGVCLMAGIVFVAAEFPVPAAVAEHLPIDDLQIVGAVLIAIVAGYLAICALRRRPLRILKWQVPLPPPALSLGQIAVSCADLMVVGGVFYVLLPDATQREFGYLGALGVFLLAWVVSAFTHVPGGVAVFESVMVAYFGDPVVAAAVVFRAIYLLFPLVIAGCLLLGHELLLSRRYIKQLAALAHHHEPPTSPPRSMAEDATGDGESRPSGPTGEAGHGATENLSGTTGEHAAGD
jgi:phosphatidylglycerol lysyltransferase